MEMTDQRLLYLWRYISDIKLERMIAAGGEDEYTQTTRERVLRLRIERRKAKEAEASAAA